MRLRRHLALCSAIILTANQPAISQGCGDILPVWQPPEERVPIYSVARVFNDEAGSVARGAATVIDKRRNLLLTASHVVLDDTAWFRFPGFDSPMLRGKVLMRIPAADGDQEDDGKAWGRARDIAVIQAEQPLPQLARPLDLRILVSMTEKLTFYGFPTATQTALYGSGRAGIPTPITGRKLTDSELDCTRVIRETTQDGDSGSAIVSNSAYVIGLNSKSFQREKQGLFIPTRCFFDSIVAMADPKIADDTYNLFTTGSRTAIAAWLADDPSRISNIDIYLAVARMLENGVGVDNLRCPIMPMASARGVPLDQLVLYARYPEQKRAIADGVILDYLFNGKSRDAIVVHNSLNLARTLYSEALSRPLNAPLPTSVAELRSTFSPTDAVIFKSISDTSLLIGRIPESNNPQYFIDAKLAAAASVVLSETPALRGAAFGSLGQAMQRSDEEALAIRAFSSAQKEGFSPEWLTRRKSNLLPAANMTKNLVNMAISDDELEKIILSNNGNLINSQNRIDN